MEDRTEIITHLPILATGENTPFAVKRISAARIGRGVAFLATDAPTGEGAGMKRQRTVITGNRRLISNQLFSG